MTPGCWQYLHTQGGPRRCVNPTDYHDGPHEYGPTIHTSADTIANQPCIAGACEPNDDGSACAYCGLPAVPVDPDELADALSIELDRERAQLARAGGRRVLMDYRNMTRGRSWDISLAPTSGPLDMPSARYARRCRAERDAGLNVTRSHWPIMAHAFGWPTKTSATQQTGAE